MNTNQKPLQGLRLAMDQLKLERQALRAHHATQFDQHVCEVYACMLAATMLAQGGFKANQSRLFGLILASLDLQEAVAGIVETADQDPSAVLHEFAALDSHYGLGESLMMDALVLSRLDKPLNATQVELLSELAEFLSLDAEQLSTMSVIAGSILGLSDAQPVPRGLDGAAYRNWSEYLPKAMVRRMPRL